MLTIGLTWNAENPGNTPYVKLVLRSLGTNVFLVDQFPPQVCPLLLRKAIESLSRKGGSDFPSDLIRIASGDCPAAPRGSDEHQVLRSCWSIAQEHLKKIEGLVLPGAGGRSIGRFFYGEPPQKIAIQAAKACGIGDAQELETERGPETDNRRNVLELFLLHGALSQGIPVLGICRGMQVINVYFGGTLVQYMDGHAGTWVEITPCSSPSAMGFASRVPPFSSVSNHRKGVIESQLGSYAGQRLLATSYTRHAPFEGHNVLTSLETPLGVPVFGVQFHPERSGDLNTGQLSGPNKMVFTNFLQSCQAFRTKRLVNQSIRNRRTQ